MSMYATDGYTSYFAVAIAWCSNMHVMEIGGAALLVIRLIADTPRAYRTIKGWLKRKPIHGQMEFDYDRKRK